MGLFCRGCGCSRVPAWHQRCSGAAVGAVRRTASWEGSASVCACQCCWESCHMMRSKPASMPVCPSPEGVSDSGSPSFPGLESNFWSGGGGPRCERLAASGSRCVQPCCGVGCRVFSLNVTKKTVVTPRNLGDSLASLLMGIVGSEGQELELTTCKKRQGRIPRALLNPRRGGFSRSPCGSSAVLLIATLSAGGQRAPRFHLSRHLGECWAPREKQVWLCFPLF